MNEASPSKRAGSNDFWAGAQPLVELDYEEVEDDEIIFAEVVKLGSQARMAAVVCKELALEYEAKVKVAYVAEKVVLDSQAEIKHLFRKQGALIELGYEAEAARGTIAPDIWEREANEFMGSNL